MREIIAANQRRSFLLISSMIMVLVMIGLLLGEAVAPGGGGLFGVMAAGVIFAIQWGIYSFSPSSLVMQGMGGRRIEKVECPRLFNIVEEMQLAAGLDKMPEVWLVDSPSPNAFAYSDARGNAAVAATTGLLWRLNRDELQGVMAHEVAHIMNRDVRFMTLAGVILGSIVILADMSLRMMRFGGRSSSRSSSSNSGGLQLALLLGLLLLAVLGPFMAQLLYFAISRKREYLADAAATVYTRYPEGLASALERIQAHAAGLPGNKVAHAMCIVPPQAAAASGETESWSSTHPPTSKRIAILRSMGTSAGLAAYEEAARQTLGGAGVVPRGDLSEASPLQARTGSEEGPIMDRPDVRKSVQAARGFRVLHCACSMEIRIPPGYESDTIRCIRCSASHRVDEAQELRIEPTGLNQPASLAPSFLPQIRCDCGHRIRVRPQAIGSAPGESISCERCGATHLVSTARYTDEADPDTYDVPAPEPGKWSHVCCPGCQGVVEVSPQFEASRIRCRGCGATLKFTVA
jgi:heat shock protein HtpX